MTMEDASRKARPNPVAKADGQAKMQERGLWAIKAQIRPAVCLRQIEGIPHCRRAA